MYRLPLVLLAALLIAPSTWSQPARFSIGPQLTTLGVGVSGAYRISPRLSLSAEANLLPIGSQSAEIDGVDYDADVQVRGALLMANVHPGGGNFSLGAGLLIGGYGLDGTATPTEPVEIGDDTYAPQEVGMLVGTFSVGGPRPTFLLGWRGRGFNFGLGATVGYASSVAFEVTGPAAARQDMRDSVEQQRQEIEDAIKKVPVLPYLRIGWQFGF